MAAIFLDGMDHYASTDSTLKYNSGSAWASMVTGLLGVGQAGTVTNGTLGPKRTLSTSYSTVIFGFRHKQSTIAASGQTLLMSLQDGSGNVVASLVLSSSGAIQFYRGSTSTLVAGSAGGLIAVNAVNYIEVKVTFSTTTTGSVDVHVNGTSVASASSVQTANTTASMTQFQFANATSGWGSATFDDFYLFDNTGSQNNTFAGDVKIVTVKPNGAGRTTGWTANGAASDWQCVSETTPDADTTYVNTTTVGAIDCYTLSSAGTMSSLLAVQINTDARKDDSATRTIAHGVGNGTTESFDAGTNVGTSYAYLVRTLDSNPLTSAAWATGDLATLQSAIKCIA